MSEPVLVLGLGNPLMGDDGLGLVALGVLQSVSATRDVEWQDGGTWGLTLLPMIENRPRVLFLDAVQDGQLPGTIVRLSGAEIPRQLHGRISPHQIDLREVLAVSALRGTTPGEMVLIGIVPERIEMGTSLSTVVRDAVPGMVRLASREIDRWLHPAGPGGRVACTS